MNSFSTISLFCPVSLMYARARWMVALGSFSARSQSAKYCSPPCGASAGAAALPPQWNETMLGATLAPKPW